MVQKNKQMKYMNILNMNRFELDWMNTRRKWKDLWFFQLFKSNIVHIFWFIFSLDFLLFTFCPKYCSWSESFRKIYYETCRNVSFRMNLVGFHRPLVLFINWNGFFYKQNNFFEWFHPKILNEIFMFTPFISNRSRHHCQK